MDGARDRAAEHPCTAAAHVRQGLHISSRENEGTEIVFAIPVRELLRRPKQGFAQEAKTRECLVFAIPGFLFG